MGWIGVDASLFLSQLGYCVVYFIFVAQNLGPLLRTALPPRYGWLGGTLALVMVQVREKKRACPPTGARWKNHADVLVPGP